MRNNKTAAGTFPTAVLLFCSHLFPVLQGRVAEFLLEGTAEVRCAAEAAALADFGDGGGGFLQLTLCQYDAGLENILHDRCASMFLKPAAEVIFADSDGLTDVADVQIGGNMFVDMFDGPTHEAAGGGGTLRGVAVEQVDQMQQTGQQKRLFLLTVDAGTQLFKNPVYCGLLFGRDFGIDQRFVEKILVFRILAQQVKDF